MLRLVPCSALVSGEWGGSLGGGSDVLRASRTPESTKQHLILGRQKLQQLQPASGFFHSAWLWLRCGSQVLGVLGWVQPAGVRPWPGEGVVPD